VALVQNGKSAPANCLVVIPAHNEADDIGKVVSEVHHVCRYPVVVVDDASCDDTAGIARDAGAIVLPLVVQLGAWGAIQAGLRYAMRKGYDFVITMDADGQHQARSLPVLLKPISDGQADVVVGACTSRGSAARKVAWKLMRQFSGLRLEDLTSGFRIYDRRAIRRLASWQATLLEYQDVGVLAILRASGIRVVDVEVDMLPRQHGSSRVFYSWASVAYYMAYTLLLGVTKRGISYRQAD